MTVPPSTTVPAPAIPPVADAVGAVGTVGAVGAVAGAGAASTSGSSSSEEQEEEELETCPEAEPSLFGLPDNNTRKDCSGEREDMGQDLTGIDFTSKDERGEVRMLPFEACASGTVSFVGGSFNMIEVTTKSGARIQYLHASRVYVKVGERVGSTTRLGVTGGTGPKGPNQYEPHLHIQAHDHEGNLIDPDCALAGKEDRKLKVGRHKKHEHKETGPSTSPLATASVTTASETTPTAPLKPAEPAILVCSNCGTPNAPGSVFCGKCGNRLASVSTSTGLTCGTCGLVNPPSARFCGRCGTGLALK